MSYETTNRDPKSTGYDAIEELLAEARGALDQPTALETMHSIIPNQSEPLDRDEANRTHRLWQDAEFHPMFNKLPRAEVVRLMREEEAARRAAAMATSWEVHVADYGSDRRRIEEYRRRGLLDDSPR
jgi:hypothetical protein